MRVSKVLTCTETLLPPEGPCLSFPCSPGSPAPSTQAEFPGRCDFWLRGASSAHNISLLGHFFCRPGARGAFLLRICVADALCGEAVIWSGLRSTWGMQTTTRPTLGLLPRCLGVHGATVGNSIRKCSVPFAASPTGFSRLDLGLGEPTRARSSSWKGVFVLGRLPASAPCLTSDLLGFARSGLKHLKIIWGRFSASSGCVC